MPYNHDPTDGEYAFLREWQRQQPRSYIRSALRKSSTLTAKGFGVDYDCDEEISEGEVVRAMRILAGSVATQTATVDLEFFAFAMAGASPGGSLGAAIVAAADVGLFVDESGVGARRETWPRLEKMRQRRRMAEGC